MQTHIDYLNSFAVAAKNLPRELTTVIKESVKGNHYFTTVEQLDFLYLIYCASKIEQNGLTESELIAEAVAQANKLMRAFGGVEAATAYLKRYEKTKRKRSKQLIHDACLFSLPAEEENKTWSEEKW